MTLMEQIVHSPRFPQYVEELKQVLQAEREKRRRFFAELREDQKAEFINGEVVVHSPVALEHEDVSSNLHALIRAYVKIHNLGYVGHEKILVSLTRNDYEPDICYFGRAKTAKLKAEQMKFPAPDMVVEVLSRSTEAVDRTIKFEDYAAHSVAEYWIVDPRKRTVEQFLLSGERYKLATKPKDGILRSRAIKGLQIPTQAAFDSKTNLQTLRQITAAGQ